MQKKISFIFTNVNLNVGSRVGPLSACPNRVSKSILSFAQLKIEFEGLN